MTTPSTSILPVVRRGEGSPVVLVHGAAPANTWGSLPDLLAHAHEVVTYARRGYPPADDHEFAGSLRVDADDIAEVVALGGPATVVGWSSGGVIALDLAIRQPKLVRGVVVMEPPLHAKRHPTLSQLRAVAGGVLRGRRNAERGARRFLEWALGRTDGRPSDLARIDPDALNAAAPAIVNEITHATGEREINRRDLHDLRTPTIWLVGTSSAAGAARLADRASKGSPSITVRHVAGAGHVIALDAPEAVVAAVDMVEKAAASSDAGRCLTPRRISAF